MDRRVMLTVAGIGLVAGCASTRTSPAAPASSAPASSTAAASSVAPASSAHVRPATLTGTLLAVGGPAGASPNPLPGSVTIAGPANQGVNLTQRVTVGPDGKYTATLPPGTYTVTGTSPQYNDGATPCRYDGDTVTLVAGQSASLDVLCEEK